MMNDEQVMSDELSILVSCFSLLFIFLLSGQDQRQGFNETCFGKHPIHNAVFAFGIHFNFQYQTEDWCFSRLG